MSDTVCRKCGKAIRRDEDGGWSHVNQRAEDAISREQANRGVQGTVKHAPKPE